MESGRLCWHTSFMPKGHSVKREVTEFKPKLLGTKFFLDHKVPKVNISLSNLKHWNRFEKVSILFKEPSLQQNLCLD